MGTHSPPGSRGQLYLDFVVGIGVFVLALAFVLSVAPGMFSAFDDDPSRPLVADRSPVMRNHCERGGVSTLLCVAWKFTGWPKFDLLCRGITTRRPGRLTSRSRWTQGASLTTGENFDQKKTQAERAQHDEGEDWLIARVEPVDQPMEPEDVSDDRIVDEGFVPGFDPRYRVVRVGKDRPQRTHRDECPSLSPRPVTPRKSERRDQCGTACVDAQQRHLDPTCVGIPDSYDSTTPVPSETLEDTCGT
jgi:hypothetical protein